jgi:hypothetical protein
VTLLVDELPADGASATAREPIVAAGGKGANPGHIVHLVQPGGRRRYVEAIGANGYPGSLGDAIAAACDPATTLLVSTALPSMTVETAVAAGRHAGARIAVDVAGDPETARSVLPSAHTVARLGGRPKFRDVDDLAGLLSGRSAAGC